VVIEKKLFKGKFDARLCNMP